MNTELTKETLDILFKELARQYRKLAGRHAKAEIILIGGASILLNYSFRNSTTDADALIIADQCMKEAILRTAEIFNLRDDWLNADFTRTTSYSPKIIEHALYYKIFYNVLEIRTVSPTYLLAMKIRSAREYKNDLSDIVGILHEEMMKGNPISLDELQQAYYDMYKTTTFPDSSNAILEFLRQETDSQKLYSIIRNKETENNQFITMMDQLYPDMLKEKGVSQVIEEHHHQNQK